MLLLPVVLSGLALGQLQLSQVYPDVPIERLYAVAHDPTLGLYVASGANGAVVISADGMSWSPRLSGTGSTLRGAAASPERLVVASSGGQILSSDDGEIWSERLSGAGFFQDVEFMGGQFVAVGRSGLIYTSSDGTVWSQRDSNTLEDLISVAYDGTLYVAVGTNGVVATSSDGLAWTEGSMGTGLEPMLGIAHGAGLWVAGGFDGQLYTSPDAIDWTPRTFSSPSQFINDVAFDGVRFIAATGTGALHTSTDGIGWTESYVSPNFAGIDALEVLAGETLMVGESGFIATTTDPALGIDVVSPLPAPLNSVNYDGAQWIVAGGDGLLATSPTGRDWSEVTLTTTRTLNDIGFGGGVRVVAGGFGTVITSSDGLSWNETPLDVAYDGTDFEGVAFGEGLFVMVGEFATVLTSPDGVSWTERNRQAPGPRLYGVRYLGERFFAVGGNGTIAQSLDGIDWSFDTGPVDTPLRDIAYDGSQFVIAGALSTLRSTDGLDWETVPAGNFRNCVAFGAGRWVIAGNNGDISESADAQSWSTVNNVVQGQYQGCRYADERFAFVNDTGGLYFEALVRTDEQGFVAVTEGGGSDSYRLLLDAAPLADVVVAISSDAQTEVDPTEVVFTPSDWTTPRTLTVTAIDDVSVEGPHSSAVSHVVSSADARFDGLPIEDVIVDVSDDDQAGVTLAFSGSENRVSEAGMTDTYSLALVTSPAQPVTVTLAPDAQLNVDPTEIVFDDTNFDTPVSVTVSAVDDAVDDDLASGTITHSVASGDPNYDGIGIPDATFEVDDNDTLGLVVSFDASLMATEGGAGDMLSVRLDSQPMAAVTVTLVPDAQVSVSPGALVFSGTDWDLPQTVDVTATDDEAVEGEHAGSLTLSVASVDPLYAALPEQAFSVAITDDDMANGNTNENSNGNTNDGSNGNDNEAGTGSGATNANDEETPGGGETGGGGGSDDGGCRSAPAPLALWGVMALLWRRKRAGRALER